MRLIALGIVEQQGKLLVFKGRQSFTDRVYFRPLGGGIEEGELSRDAIQREFMEELGTQIEILEQLPVLENVYRWADRRKHEVAFLYRVRLKDETLYHQERISVLDDGVVAFWKPLEDFARGDWLIPEGLAPLLLKEKQDPANSAPLLR